MILNSKHPSSWSVASEPFRCTHSRTANGVRIFALEAKGVGTGIAEPELRGVLSAVEADDDPVMRRCVEIIKEALDG